MNKNVLKRSDVVYIKFPHECFSYADGLYIVVDVVGSALHICRLDVEGKPFLFSDGNYMTVVTGVENEGIVKTNLSYNLDNK